MANPEHLDILTQGVEVWNQWRENNPDIRPDLFDARLGDAYLSSANLQHANMVQVQLAGANLSRANLLGAALHGAILTGTNLREANLNSADAFMALLEGAILEFARLSVANLASAKLVGGSLTGASLHSTNLSGADLRDVDLSYCIAQQTIFADTDLSLVKGLETVEHIGPSTIGIDTIYRSKGRIPEVFLRGAGVPDDLIRSIPSLVAKPFHFYSCFLCYSTKDKRFCDRLYADLQANGVRVWYFPEDAMWGEPVWGEIDRSIRIHDKLVVICSEDSLQSGPVLREIERALQREDREGKNILFPIRIDDYLLDEWEHPRKPDVRSKVVGDFRGWDTSTDKCDTAFQKLLTALQAGD